MREERLEYLIQNFLSQTLTEEESQELDNFIRVHPNLSQLLKDNEALDKAMLRMDSIDTQKNLKLVLSRIHSQPTPRKRVIQMPMKPVMAAAAISAILVGAYFVFAKHEPEKQAKIADSTIQVHLPPGRNSAILRLAGGKEINMDTVSTGEIINEGNTNIIKKDRGTVIYAGLTPSFQQNTSETSFNTLTTPNAGQFVVILPDGSKVSLNNASSLHFPSAFTGKSREVELTGEAYFEVTHNTQQPFNVHAGSDQIDEIINVLGTSFNISAYNDEKQILTTLESGKVKVICKGQSRILDSVRKIAAADQNSLEYQEDGDPLKALAWKKGIFYFSHDNLSDVMRQIDRWYNIHTNISQDLNLRKYSATIPRNSDLASTLKILSEDNDKTYFHYSLKGNELFIKR